MAKIDEVFQLHTAKSGSFAQHGPGTVAFATNGFKNNGVLGFVKPLPSDKVFKFLGITLSAFCEATVQIPPFIARGNGGSGLIVLEPKETLSAAQLGYIAAYINKDLRWRFSWSRQASVDRVRRLEIPDPATCEITFDVKPLLPGTTEMNRSRVRSAFDFVTLDAIYAMVAGDYHNASSLPEGDIPLVSCGDANNGIMGFVDVPTDRVYDHRLTIAFNGMNTLTAKYHPYQFATKDDVAVCEPREPLRLSSEIFIQLMLNRERWRYSYYRKCYMDKLKRFSIPLPVKNGGLDEDAMEAILTAHPYWQFVKTRLEKHA
jgi:hypothetical protein